MDPMIFLIIVIAAIWAIGQIMAKRLENHLKKYGMPQGLAYYHGVSGGSDYRPIHSSSGMTTDTVDIEYSPTMRDTSGDIFYDPSYSSFPCNVYHHDDSSSSMTDSGSDMIFSPVYSSLEGNIYNHDD